MLFVNDSSLVTVVADDGFPFASGYADIGVFSFTGAVEDAAHDSHFYRFSNL